MSAQDLGDFQLIHIGPQGWQNEDISDLVTHLKKSGRLRQLGYLSEPDLADLVSAARAMVFPSKYEGFGLPIVEAMASATPVITTNYGAMSEVAGGAAKLVSGTDEEELAQALCDIISDDEKFQSLQTAGIARAKHFSWQACAEQTLKVYETL
jgi:alpha-1,3-rhamnosyl/mannosyltransferase